MELQMGRPVVVGEHSRELVGVAELRCRGRLADDGARLTLARHMGALHEYVVARGIAAFTVDVRELRFIDSSAIRVFVAWTSRAEAARYKLVFKTDAGVTWHRLSFSVLRSLAPASVEIVERRL
jgi:hypothetical protein